MASLTPDQSFEQLGLKLPPAPTPLGVYKPFLIIGNCVYVSGQGTVKEDKSLIIGRIGKDLTMEEGKLAARQVGLAILATLKANLGSLNKVKRVIKTFGLVLCTPEFTDQPKVMNGFSELMAEVFGDEAGVGARSAVGTSALPGGMAVEVECIFEVE